MHTLNKVKALPYFGYQELFEAVDDLVFITE